MGYTRRREKARRAYLAEHPLCEDTFGVHGNRVVAGTHVAHILPLARGGTDDEENLQTLCASCHSRKTVKYDGGFGRTPADR